MELRLEVKKGGAVVLQVMAAPGISDGDLATLLEDAEQDLRWNVAKDAEVIYTRGGNNA